MAMKLLMMNERVDVNLKKSNDGQTSIMIAAALGRVEIVELLLKESRVEVNMKYNLHGMRMS